MHPAIPIRYVSFSAYIPFYVHRFHIVVIKSFDPLYIISLPLRGPRITSEHTAARPADHIHPRTSHRGLYRHNPLMGGLVAPATAVGANNISAHLSVLYQDFALDKSLHPFIEMRSPT